jgi:hypothetical protein
MTGCCTYELPVPSELVTLELQVGNALDRLRPREGGEGTGGAATTRCDALLRTGWE